MPKQNKSPDISLPGAPPVAVVDIGSNSVRLNIYEAGRRSPALLYSEKSICRLGRGVVAKGVLAPEAVTATLSLLRRFGVLIRHIGVSAILPVATAAVREAKNGAQFVADADRALGAPVRVLTGGEEGKFAALGVQSSLPDAKGIVADLGGGSLELVAVGDGPAKNGETAPLGSLRLRDLTGDVEAARAVAEKALGTMAVLAGDRAKNLYAVGGSWRALARIHMLTSGYPLHLIDGYQISADEAVRIAAQVAGAPAGWLREILGKTGTSSARLEILPYAAVVMAELIKRASPQTIMFSARGVRDGLVFAALPKNVAALDPLVAGCRDLGAACAPDPGQFDEFADELFSWAEGVFAPRNQGRDGERLRRCVCLLANVGRRAQPDFRGATSLGQIAFSTITGIDHRSRAFLALAVYFSHRQRVEGELCQKLVDLAGEPAWDLARQLGAALRLAQALRAERPGGLRVLQRSRLAICGTRLTLTLAPEIADLGGLRVEKRLSYLAKLTGHDWAVALGAGG
ncbi:MAG: Ppx/GppA phosphatase family protein [Alphaproteobacteria bacterium]